MKTHIDPSRQDEHAKKYEEASQVDIQVQDIYHQYCDDEEMQMQPFLPHHETRKQRCIATVMAALGMSTANLAKHLPTGAVLAFQILSPLSTNMGHCSTANQAITLILLIVFGFLCFILSFSDSFTDDTGIVRYGFATCHGLWIIGGSSELQLEMAETYRIRFIDFMHGFTSLIVFAAVVLVDSNVVYCFYPEASEYEGLLLGVLPIIFGALGSFLFVVFPTTRHGIGFHIFIK